MKKAKKIYNLCNKKGKLCHKCSISDRSVYNGARKQEKRTNFLFFIPLMTNAYGHCL